jgi:hypothetical protein
MTQTGVDVADVEAILQFSDDSARKAAFDHYWNKLGTASSSRIDLVALKLCIRLLPSQQVSMQNYEREGLSPTLKSYRQAECFGTYFTALFKISADDF